jgi:uncharacterized protein (TIGR02391 family)
MISENLIENYRKLYNVLTPHHGTRKDVLPQLNDFIKNYDGFLKNGTTKSLSFDVFNSKIESFLKSTFNPIILKIFLTPSIPKETSKKQNNESDNVTFILKEISEFIRSQNEHNRSEQKRKYDFLNSIYSCLRDYGLHKTIGNRENEIYNRYSIIIEYHSKGKTSKELGKLFPFEALLKNYIKPYKCDNFILINGKKISNENISRIFISSTVLNDYEIPLYKEKYGLKTDIEFVRKCTNETNRILNNSAVANREIESNYNSLDIVHPKIKKLCYDYFQNGQYSEAVRAVFIELNDIVKQEYRKQKNGEELDGDKLMRFVFSPNSPIFKLADINTESGKNIQQGYMEIFAGSMKGIRNPLAHKNFEIDDVEAFEKIILASHLLKKFENSLNNII